MPIKNKDGTVFKLRGPNPLMKEQNLWDATQFVLHNMKFKFVVAMTDTIVTPMATDFKIRDEPSVEKQPEPEIVETVEPRIIQGKRPEEDIKLTTCHCLPANINDVEDSIYGDRKRVFVYEQLSFIFEMVIVDQTDLDLRMWTTLSHIGPGSIIYPQNSDRRWWRIQSRQVIKGGWLYDCVLSDYQPAFHPAS